MYVSHVGDHKELFLLPFHSFRFTLDLEKSEEISEGSCYVMNSDHSKAIDFFVVVVFLQLDELNLT